MDLQILDIFHGNYHDYSVENYAWGNDIIWCAAVLFVKIALSISEIFRADKMNYFAGKSIHLKTVMCIRGIIWLSHLIKLEMGLSWLQQE